MLASYTPWPLEISSAINLNACLKCFHSSLFLDKSFISLTLDFVDKSDWAIKTLAKFSLTTLSYNSWVCLNLCDIGPLSNRSLLSAALPNLWASSLAGWFFG